MAASLASGGVLGVQQKKQLQSFSQRAIKVLEEREALNEDLKSIFDEAREAGFDTKIMRKAIKRVRTDAEVRQAEEEMIDAYVHAIQPDLFPSSKAA